MVLESVGAREETSQELTAQAVCLAARALPTEVSMNRRAHWQRVYTAKTSDGISWFQPEPTVSAKLLQSAGLQPHT